MEGSRSDDCRETANGVPRGVHVVSGLVPESVSAPEFA